MKNIEEKTNEKGNYKLNEQIYQRFGILGNSSPVVYGGLGGYAMEMSVLGIIRDYAGLDEEHSKKLFSIENKLGINIKPFEFRRKKDSVELVEKYYFDEQKNFGICFNKMEKVEQDKTFFAYGLPKVFTDKNEFQQVVDYEEKINKILTSNLFKKIFSISKFFKLGKSYSELIHKNERVLSDERALNYILEQYIEKPIKK